MRHYDLLYGEWELPPIVLDLFRTRELVRLRDISQTIVPNLFLPRGPVGSRAHHGLGVARLAELVLRANPSLAPQSTTLYAAALLHDAGNPPFSHLSEPFLRAALGRDGESFLEEVLEESEARDVLTRYGVSFRDVLDLVTGARPPFSDVLNGSLDIDNLDNIGRYAADTRLPIEPFDALRVASRFRFDGVRWTLSSDVFSETRRWQAARQTVYDLVYDTDHIAVTSMLSRAIGMAFLADEIHPEFFLMSNTPATLYLSTQCSEGTKCLMERLARFLWYEEVFRIEEVSPSFGLRRIAESWEGIMTLSDRVADRLGVAPHDVAAFAELGRHKRRILLPFVREDGSEFFDESNGEQAFHLRVFVNTEVCADRSVVREVVEEVIG